MSYVVDLLVSFPCSGTRGVVELARQLLPAVEAQAEAVGSGADEAAQLLAYLGAGQGIATGPRGGTFAWGVSGNRTEVDMFVDTLRPFWQELLRLRLPPDEQEWDGPLSVESILVLHEGEGQGYASAIKIQSADPHRTTELPGLTVVRYDRLPFSLFSTQNPGSP